MRARARQGFLGLISAIALVGSAQAAPPTAGTGTGAETAAQAPSPDPKAEAMAALQDIAAFQAWVADLRTEALAQGISAATFDTAFRDTKPIPRVIELDRYQPEFSQTFWTYMSRAVSPERIERGREMLRKHGPLLRQIQRQYGVQPRFLVAFWGMETAFGATFGGFPVVDALATLAYDTRRSAFFRKELLDALRILDAGHIPPARMQGSWAGAMGHLQFMPSTFRAHAVDRDGDARADIWGSLPDVFASAANYLSREGWKGDQTWGREVRLPAGFNLDLIGLGTRKPLAEWAKLGLRRADGGALPVVRDMSGSLVLPAGIEGPAFLVYDNFRTTMVWNRSILYALAVGHLADRLAGLPELVADPPKTVERPLSRNEVLEMQALLNRLGHDAGAPDGLAGSRTRAALKAFQKATGRIADGFPDRDALRGLRAAARQAEG